MNRLLVLLAGLALAGAAAAASPQPAAAGSDTGWHWWLHPKLGMVKVDRATHGIIVSGRKARTLASAAN